MNCHEDEHLIAHGGNMVELPLARPTQSTYMLLDYATTKILRELFDGVCRSKEEGNGIEKLFSHVLEADDKLKEFGKKLPQWLRADGPVHATASGTESHLIANIRRTFRINYAHKRIWIHRMFFCRGISDRRYYYSHLTCLESARAILLYYQETALCGAVDIWTIPANVMSACIMVTLNILFFKDTDDFMAGRHDSGHEDKAAMYRCLDLLEQDGSYFKNHIVRRGRAIIGKLLDRQTDHGTLQDADVGRLVQEVESLLQQEQQQMDFSYVVDLDNVFFDFLDSHTADLQ